MRGRGGILPLPRHPTTTCPVALCVRLRPVMPSLWGAGCAGMVGAVQLAGGYPVACNVRE